MSRTIALCLCLSLPLAAQDQPVPKPPIPAPAQPAAEEVDPEPEVEPGEEPAEDDPAPPANENPANPVQPPIPGLNPPPANPDPQDPPPAPARAVVPNAPDPNLPATLDAANLTGQDIAELYHQYTGKRVLVSQEASTGEVSFIVPGKMTYAEAARIIEKKLVMEGYELVPDDDDPGLVKLILANSPSSGVKALGAPIVGSLEDLQELVDAGRVSADGFVTFVMPLVYLKPDDALRAFQSVVQQFGAAGTVAAVPNAGSLVISGNLPLVRMLVELKERIDVPSAQVGTKFIEVTYADVEDLADRLNEIFNNQRQTQQSARVQRTTTPTSTAPPIPINTPNNPAAAAGGAGGAGGAGEDTPINIIPQPRTSRIFLMGRPADIIFVEGLIADFDAPSSKRNFLRTKLRYLPVTEFIPVAADALERTLETSVGAAGGARRSGGSTNRATGVTPRTQFGTNNTTNTRNTFGAGNTGGFGGGGARAQIAQQQIQTAPESILIGKTLLVGDNISNSVVVNGPPHHIEIVEDLVRELDQPSEQVAITAVFGTYNITKDRSFGLDMAQLLDGGRDFTGTWQNRGGVVSNTVIDPNTIVDLPALLGSAAAPGISASVAIGDSFGLFVNALESNNNFTAVSRPTVFTTNNGTARLSSGRRIAVPTSTFTNGGSNFGQSTNIEFRDITLELEVRPLVNSNDEVTLEIALVRDDTNTSRSIGDLTNIPDIETDEITTRVTVPNRSIIVLGGLITESDRKDKGGIPVLSNLPGIGPLFGSGSRGKIREELVILIHPTILSNQKDLSGYQQTFDSKSKVAPQARSSVEGAGVLPPRGAYNPNAGAGRAVPVEQKASSGPIMTSPSHRAMRSKRRR